MEIYEVIEGTNISDSKIDTFTIGNYWTLDDNDNLHVDVSSKMDIFTFSSYFFKDSNDELKLLYNAKQFEIVDNKLNIQYFILTSSSTDATNIFDIEGWIMQSSIINPKEYTYNNNSIINQSKTDATTLISDGDYIV